MCASWKKVGRKLPDPDSIARELEKATIRSESGQVSFNPFRYDQCMTVLNSLIEFSVNVPEFMKWKFVTDATQDVARAGKLSGREILRAVQKIENKYLAQPERNFVLVTNLSVRNFNSFQKTRFYGCRIRMDVELPKRFDRQPAQDKGAKVVFGNLPVDYSWCRISVRARSPGEAGETSLDAINLLRGIWNLVLNRFVLGRPVVPFRGKRKPVNRILLGPIHTIHEPDGKLAGETCWFERDYLDAQECIDLRWEGKQLRNDEKKIRNALRCCKYRNMLEDAIRQYTRALDSSDYVKSFLGLWSLLEKLTFSGHHHDKAIDRVLFIIDKRERKIHQQILRQLRMYRNEVVHSGHDRDEIEPLLYQLKWYVEALLHFHITRRLPKDDIERFLSLATDPQELRKQILLRKEALRLHS